MANKAFTIIELLVVVAIIAILAAIAIPNLLEAQTRSKVSRTRADLRSLATGLELYLVDNNTYPPDGNGGSYQGLIAMTTPIAYLTTIAPDPFNKGYIDGYAADRTEPNSEINLARYYELGTGNLNGANVNFPAMVWALAAYGPDIDDDTDTVGSYPFTKRAVPYDPTNGTISNGDLYRFGPAKPQINYLTDANPLVFN